MELTTQGPVPADIKPAPALFASFLQGGFECSTHKRRDGRRLDLTAATGHDVYISQDYLRLRSVGMRTVREGLRWHLIEKVPGKLDFSLVTPFLKAAEHHGIEIVWDLLHFGWPDYLDIFSSEWVTAFRDFAFGFARYLIAQGLLTPWIAPVNEISFLAWGGGDVECLNPYLRGRGPELKVQLVKGALAAIGAIRAELPGARIVSPEPVIHISGSREIPGDEEQAENYRLSMFEAWDMLTGRAMPELKGNQNCIDVLGVNFYPRNEWLNSGPVLNFSDPGYKPLHRILGEVHQRYGLPLFVSETGTEDDERPPWFAYISEQVRLARKLGVPVHGICLYPILNHPGWDDDRHCYNGLWDYPSPTGEREIYLPLANEIFKQSELTF